MSNIVTITDANFMEYSKSPLLMIDFGAQWCVHCHKIEPFIEEIADEMAGKLIVAKVDVDKAPMVAARLRVRSLPTVIVMKDGQVVNTIIGAQPKQAFVDAIPKD